MKVIKELIFKQKVELVKYPAEVLDALRPITAEVVEAQAAKSPMAKKVNKSFKKFQKGVGTWGSVSEKEYYNIIQPNFPLKG